VLLQTAKWTDCPRQAGALDNVPVRPALAITGSNRAGTGFLEFVALNIQPRRRGEPVIRGGRVPDLLLKCHDVVDLRLRIGAVMAWIYPPTASFTHLFVKLVLAAPASFFSPAAASQLAFASRSHLPMKLVLAAPASFFSVAWLEQDESAALALIA